MKISDLDFYLVAVPRSDSHIKVQSLLVRLASDTGHEGWGEANLPWRPAELEARRHALLPLLAGRSVFNIEDLMALDSLRPMGLKAALEIASWDMIGRAARQPLCHLLGGTYRSRIPLAARLPSEAPESVPIRARELSERGFHTQILTLTGQAEADQLQIRLATEAAGGRVQFRIDGQGMYPIEMALELCNELERYETVRYFIDPVAGGDVQLTSMLRRQTAVELGLQMRIRGTPELMEIARAGAAQHVSLPLGQLGGISAVRKCSCISEAANISTALAAAPSLGLSLAAMLQVAAAVPNLATANESAYHELGDDVLCERIEVVDGMAAVPEGPGLGIEIDRHKLERYQLA